MIPEPLKFNGNDLKDELRKDPALKIDIKRNDKLPNLNGIDDEPSDMAIMTMPITVMVTTGTKNECGGRRCCR
jgi:hypothetical protein